MKNCCVKYMGGAISLIHYCSGDLWNSSLNIGVPKDYILFKFCPECGENLVNVVQYNPELAEARGIKPIEKKEIIK